MHPLLSLQIASLIVLAILTSVNTKVYTWYSQIADVSVEDVITQTTFPRIYIMKICLTIKIFSYFSGPTNRGLIYKLKEVF